MKTCASCKVDKELDSFGVDRRRTDGRHPYCLECSRARHREWVSKNKQKHAKSCADWYVRNKESRYRVWTKHHYKKNYGITYEQFLERCSVQDNKCEICKTPLVLYGPKANEKAAMDHNHSTGELRGVLCSRCNWGLGKFRDSPELLREAAAYLEKYNSYSTD